MTNGVDASMNQVQSTPLQPAVNRTGRQSEPPELCPADDSVLLLRQPSDDPIDGSVWQIRLIALIRPPIRPPLTTAEVAKGGRVRHRRRW